MFRRNENVDRQVSRLAVHAGVRPLC